MKEKGGRNKINKRKKATKKKKKKKVNFRLLLREEARKIPV
jgi:hypothetical protein